MINESILIDFVAGALVSTVITWVENGFIETPEFLAEQVSFVLAHGVYQEGKNRFKNKQKAEQ